MTYKLTFGRRFFEYINYLFMIMIALTMIYPFVNLLALSLSSPGPVLKGEVNILPKGFTFETYRILLTTNKMMQTMGNTVYITIFGTLISLTMTILFAYPLSRDYMKIKGSVIKFVVFTMLFNGGMIPSYLLIKKLGMLDTYWSLIVPGAISAYNLIILINFFKAIPKELEEAGTIDGMNELQILLFIVIPLSMHAIATQALFYAVAKWNTFFQAIMYINDMKKYPLQVMLRQIILLDEAIGNSGADAVLEMPPETKKAASIFFSVIPILCVYPYLQRFFITGVTVGSIKG